MRMQKIKISKKEQEEFRSPIKNVAMSLMLDALTVSKKWKWTLKVLEH